MAAESCDIRPMTPADLDPVLAVERECYPFPWTAELFLQELANPFAAIDLFLIDKRIAGYICSWLIQGELHILNLATSPDFRRRGVAAALLRQAIERASSGGLEKAFLEVRVSNEGAITLYLGCGFHPVYRRPAYYPDGEDAWVMEKSFPAGLEQLPAEVKTERER